MVRNSKRWYWIVVAAVVCTAIAACGQNSKARSFVKQGNAKLDLGQYQEAIVDYDQAIRLELDDAYAYYNRGVAKFALGQYQEAIADYDQAIELDPNFAFAYNNRVMPRLTLINTGVPSPIMIRRSNLIPNSPSPTIIGA